MRERDSTGEVGKPPASRRAKDAASLSRLAAIVDNSPDAILVVDLGGTVTDWNHGAERLYGYSAEEMIGGSISAVVPREAAGELDNILETVRRGDVIGPYDTVRLRRDGTPVYVSLTAAPITDVQGALIGVSWIGRDITERKRAEDALRENEAQLSALYEQSPAGVVLSELASGRLLRVNETFARILGFTCDEVRGRTMAELGMVSSDEERERLIGGLREGAAYTNREMTVRAKGGRQVFVLASARVIALGGRQCIVNAGIDITERKAAEDALREADRRKNEFLAMLSHELRNPMAAISAAVQLMGTRGLDEAEAGAGARRCGAPGAPHGPPAGRSPRRRSHHPRHHRAAAADVALGDVVETAIDTARPAIEAKGHALRVAPSPEPLRLRADPTRLSQVVANLLDNAAKYTPAGGHILVSAEREGDEAVVRVRDDGVGIPAEMLPHVFDLFVQGERSPARSEGGLGIGLTMVRRLVELHGGRVEARSDGPGKGSEFLVWLPLLPAHAQPPEAEAPRGQGGPAPAGPGRGRRRRCGGRAGDGRGDGRPRRAGRAKRAGRDRAGRRLPVRTWSCWTSACLEWTATRWRAACASRRAGRG